MSLILASRSPRRRELLSLLTPDFIVIPPEDGEGGTGTPEERAIFAAHAKAHEVATVSYTHLTLPTICSV